MNDASWYINIELHPHTLVRAIMTHTSLVLQFVFELILTGNTNRMVRLALWQYIKKITEMYDQSLDRLSKYMFLKQNFFRFSFQRSYTEKNKTFLLN